MEDFASKKEVRVASSLSMPSIALFRQSLAPTNSADKLDVVVPPPLFVVLPLLFSSSSSHDMKLNAARAARLKNKNFFRIRLIIYGHKCPNPII